MAILGGLVTCHNSRCCEARQAEVRNKAMGVLVGMSSNFTHYLSKTLWEIFVQEVSVVMPFIQVGKLRHEAMKQHAQGQQTGSRAGNRLLLPGSQCIVLFTKPSR